MRPGEVSGAGAEESSAVTLALVNAVTPVIGADAQAGARLGTDGGRRRPGAGRMRTRNKQGPEHEDRNMRTVAVFPGLREVRLIERAPPRITEAGQALLRVLDVGICGTDREICSFEYGSPPPGRRPSRDRP